MLFYHLAEAGVDGGVFSANVDTGRSERLTPKAGTPDRERNLLLWSPSGRTLISTLCNVTTCSVDVIDPKSGTARRMSKDFAADGATDTHLVGFADAAAAARPWKTYNLATGSIQTVAERWIARTSESVVLDDHRFLVAGEDAAGMRYNIVLVDTDGGTEQLVLGQAAGEEALRLRGYLRSPRWALLGAEPVGEILFRGTGGSYSILDVESGTLVPPVARVGQADADVTLGEGCGPAIAPEIDETFTPIGGRLTGPTDFPILRSGEPLGDPATVSLDGVEPVIPPPTVAGRRFRIALTTP
ncbi:MAG: hypothetical protein H0X16_12100, partial [Chloroflexi bacterium]|nr:hypothetical protein [Chloroflexota bacterium]